MVSMSGAFYREVSEGIVICVKVIANSSKTEFREILSDLNRIKLKVSAMAMDGKANEEIKDYLRKTFKLSKTDIVFLRGELAREKDILLRGVSLAEFQKIVDSL